MRRTSGIFRPDLACSQPFSFFAAVVSSCMPDMPGGETEWEARPLLLGRISQANTAHHGVRRKHRALANPQLHFAVRRPCKDEMIRFIPCRAAKLSKSQHVPPGTTKSRSPSRQQHRSFDLWTAGRSYRAWWLIGDRTAARAKQGTLQAVAISF